MKISKLFMGALAGLLLASVSFAQTTIIGVGSSAAFPSAAISALIGDPIKGTGPICGTRFWSISGKTGGGNNFAYGDDTGRNGAIPQEAGTLWVAWDNDTAPTTVCAYLSVDSVVGQRLLFGQTAGGSSALLKVDALATSTAGGNKVSYVQDTATTGLPAAIYAAINNQPFNIAFTDIRPEDGAFAYTRACAPDDPAGKSSLGYGTLPPPTTCGGIGQAIQSSWSRSSAQVIAYAISGTDPFTGHAIPAYTTTPIGAVPIMIVVNKTTSTGGHFGNPKFVDVTTQVAGRIFDGTLGLSGDISNDNSLDPSLSAPLYPVLREPLSGTYNVFEWQLVRARDGDAGRSQETGTPTPSAANSTVSCAVAEYPQPNPATYVRPAITLCANPLFISGDYGSFRSRAIGTGEMSNVINNANQDNAIGYYFYSAGTVGGKTGTKYLTLGGSDPLYANGTNPAGIGNFPNCTGKVNLGTFSCSVAQPTFPNINNGSYRVWSVIRAVTLNGGLSPAQTTLFTNLVQGAQDQFTSATAPHDFLPYQTCANAACLTFNNSLVVFRSHYTISGVAAANSINNSANEKGGDMAGAVINDQAEAEVNAWNGSSLITLIQ